MKKLYTLLVVLLLILALIIIAISIPKTDNSSSGNNNSSVQTGNNQGNQNAGNNNTNNNVNNENATNSSTNTSGSKVSTSAWNVNLKSSENRTVYNFYDKYFMVFDYDETGKVVARYNYYCFETKEEAIEHYDNSRYDYDLMDYSSVNIVDNYVIYTIQSDAYQKLTKEEVLNKYSYLEKVT